MAKRPMPRPEPEENTSRALSGELFRPKPRPDRKDGGKAKKMAYGGKAKKMAMGGKCRGMGAATKGGNYSRS